MGELEAQVLSVLWDAEGWLTPGNVHAVVGRGRPLAYTTVMTILVRLWQKGVVERRREGRAFAYHPVQSRAEHAGERMRQMLATAGNRSAALAHFVGAMTPSERAQLRKALSRGRR